MKNQIGKGLNGFSAALVAMLTLAAVPVAHAATTGFNQTGAGPWDYNTTGNWVGGTINGTWDTSLTLAAGQTVTYAANTTLATPLSFNYAGNFPLALTAASATPINLTLGGDISLNTSGGTAANVTIGDLVNVLNVNLGNTARNLNVATNRTLTFLNVLSSSGTSGGITMTNLGAGTVILSGANTYTGPTIIRAGNTLTVNGTGTIGGGASATSLTVGGTGNGSANAVFNYYSSGSSIISALLIGAGGTGSPPGVMNMTNGTLTVNTIDMSNSKDATSTLNLSGGTLNVSGAYVYVGERGSSVTASLATVNATNGILNVAGILTIGAYSSGAYCQGVFNQVGGTVNANSVQLAAAAADAYNHAGTYNLTGGTLTTASITGYINSSTGVNSSTCNFNGGTLKPTTSTATFLKGLTACNVQNGGAIIDTTNFNITIPQPLLHFSGATTDGLTKLGAGTLTLTGTNTYAGITTISNGTLALAGTGSIAGSSVISVGGGAAFDVSGLAAFTLGAGQTLSNNASATGTISGNLNTSSGTVSVSYLSSPALSVTNGVLTLSASTSFSVSTTGSWSVGSYKIISKGAGGSVAGTVPAVSAPGTTSSLSISNGELYLVVSAIVTVIPTTTGLALSSGSNPSTLGSALTFQATVSPAPTNGSVITFLDGATILGTRTTTSGVAAFSTNSLSLGSHSITASYGGNGTYLGSVSSPLVQIVNWVGPTLSDSNLFAALNLNYPGLELVRTNVNDTNYTAAKTNLANYLLARTNVAWYFDPHQVTNTVSYSLSAANSTVMANVTEVGINYTFANSNIDWLYNVTLDTNYNYAATSEWQWQLNRMDFWPNLGNTYWGTGNELYPQTWVKQLEGWFTECPVPSSVQQGAGSPWRTLEAGLRMSGNWPNTFFRCLTSPSFGSEVMAHYLKSCIEHARYLNSYPTSSGNWVTTEQAGLYTVGALFPELNESTNWRTYSSQRLYGYQTNQFYPDGAELELTPNYDLISQASVLSLYNLAVLEGRAGELPTNYVANLQSSFAYSMWLLAPDGTLPAFNDTTAVSGVADLQTGYSLYPNRTDFLYASTFGAAGTPPAQTSYSFPYAGYNVMRSDWSSTANYLCFAAGPLGQQHQHNDALNVVLWAWGREILFDSGGGQYNASLWRSYGISSASHNTIMVDGLDQYGGVNGIQITASMTDPDYVAQGPLAMRWENSLTHNFAAGTYSRGYNTYNNRPARQTRRVLFVQPDIYLIADTMVPTNTASHTYELRWNLLPATTKLDATTQVISTTNAGLANLAIVPCLQSSLTVAAVVGQSNGPSATQLAGWNIIETSPPGYTTCTTVKHSLAGTGTNQFLTLLLPLAVGKTNPVSAVVSTGPSSARVDLADGRKFYVSADPNSAGNVQFTEVLANGTTNRNISSGLGVPTVSQIPDQLTAKNTTLGPVGFCVGTSSGSVSNLILSAHSTNQTLVPDGNIVFGGSGTNRTLTIAVVAAAPVAPVMGHAGRAEPLKLARRVACQHRMEDVARVVRAAQLKERLDHVISPAAGRTAVFIKLETVAAVVKAWFAILFRRRIVIDVIAFFDRHQIARQTK
jgi:autotransporter-associated beta strand protein